MHEITINAGIYSDHGRNHAIKTISELPRDKSWRLSVVEAKKKRTDAQNRALWGVAYAALREQTGNDPEDLHEYFLGEYFGWEEYGVLGRKKLRPMRRSSKLRTTEFAEFYAFVQRLSAENGYFVPDPREVLS